MSEHPAAETIEQVIDRLTQIIDTARDERSPLGYFPALYRKVTVRVAQGIKRGEFDDGAWLERLDVVFAGRYLSAYDAYRAGESPSQSWAYAFRVAGESRPIVLQHLLLGINAHINLDLGIATAQSVGSEQELERRRADFDRINSILAGLVEEVKEKLATTWMTLRFFNRYLGSVEDAIINFSLEESRVGAWKSAQNFVALAPPAWPDAIERRDRKIAKVGHIVRHPGVIGTTVNHIIRLGERGGVARKIDILS
jgi:hypothetical protein